MTSYSSFNPLDRLAFAASDLLTLIMLKNRLHDTLTLDLLLAGI